MHQTISRIKQQKQQLSIKICRIIEEVPGWLGYSEHWEQQQVA